MTTSATASLVPALPGFPRRGEMALYGIYEISKLLSGLGSLTEILGATLSVLHSFLDMSNGLVALLDGAGNPELLVAGACDAAWARAYYASLPERVVGQIVATEIPFAVGNVNLDTSFPWDTSCWGPAGHNFSFLGVPIKDRDRIAGVLTIDRAWQGHPSQQMDDDLRFLKMVANLIGQTVRLHRLVARDRERLLEDQRRYAHEKQARGGEPMPDAPSQRIIGNSPALRAVMATLRLVARSHSPVLLRGESGTGKELFAQALHDLSPRCKKPFIKLNCAALPESVLESELFGHEKGAFTGAVVQRKGRFELADGGTLFLDEIGEISPAFQVKLLRVLQEGEFERVGGTRTLKVDIRLVTATNRNLEEAVARNIFRADLYYRIAVVPLSLPPLRDRKSDIPLLAEHFLRRFNADNGTRLTLAPEAISVLMDCYFPGNIRELENCIRRTATLTRGPSIQQRDFACRNDGCLSAVLWKTSDPGVPPTPRLVKMTSLPASACPAAPACDSSAACQSGAGESKPERQALIEAMERSGWVQAKAARLLGLTPRQIGYAIRKHGIPIQRL